MHIAAICLTITVPQSSSESKVDLLHYSPFNFHACCSHQHILFVIAMVALTIAIVTNKENFTKLNLCI